MVISNLVNLCKYVVVPSVHAQEHGWMTRRMDALNWRIDDDPLTDDDDGILFDDCQIDLSSNWLAGQPTYLWLLFQSRCHWISNPGKRQYGMNVMCGLSSSSSSSSSSSGNGTGSTNKHFCPLWMLMGPTLTITTTAPVIFRINRGI